nr:MAG TPA: hypothetical protein [Caudoviricetes sp.]
MEYLDIIEENFTKSDYVAYLRGSILMWLLEDKPFDTAQFKLYADKLVEVMEEQSTDTTDDECHCLQTQAPEPTVDQDEPRVIKPFKFKLGDHVIISKGTEDERTGVIIRLPMEGVDCSRSYVVDLDDKNLGWDATVAVDGVDCKNAWVAGAKNMELLPEQSKILQKNTWYHTTDFTLEELKELLPKGTRILVEKQVLYDGIETTPPTETQTTMVESVKSSFITKEPLIRTTSGTFLKEWFMLQENTTLQEDL